MKSVTQKHNFGCGVACVAFITGKSYGEVVSVLGEKRAENEGFYCRDLVSALSKFSLAYTYKYVKPRIQRQIHQDGVIVFIKRSKKYPAGHYLARHNGLWMDPWVNFLHNGDVYSAKSGFRKRLPGKSIYALLPVSLLSNSGTIKI